MRRAAKSDANQGEIIAALHRLGFTVASLHRVGGGVPDLLAGRRGVNHLIEVKDGAKSPSRRKLTEAQEEFHAGWKGTVVILSGVDELVEWAGGLS